MAADDIRAPPPPTRPGNLNELGMDVGVGDGQLGVLRIIKRPPEHPKELDRGTAAEATIDGLGKSCSAGDLESQETELLPLPAPGQRVVGNDLKTICRHHKVKWGCLICTPGGDRKPQQVSAIPHRSENVGKIDKVR